MFQTPHRVSLALLGVAAFTAAVVLAIWVVAKAGSAATLSPSTRGTILFDAGVGGFVASRSAIYLIGSDGTRQRLLTSSSGVNSTPTWSPDGKRIAYLNGNYPRLWVMNADGSGKHQMDRYGVGRNVPQWSPDGSKIAFERAPPVVGGAVRGGTTLWVVEADGSSRHSVPRGSKIGDALGAWGPTWSREGERIAFLRISDRGPVAWVARADGTRAHSLKKLADSLAWSPDSRWIAFQHDLNLSIMRPDGTGTRRLAEASSGAGSYSWSPDAKHIAYVDYTGRLMVVGLDGKGRRRLTGTGEMSLPSWSPDGAAIAYMRPRSSGQDFVYYETLYVVSVAGGSPTPIGEIDGQSEAMEWRPNR